MKKFFTAAVAVVMLPATVFAAFTPGTYMANINSNIRSMPSMSGTLIGHYNKGDMVNVLQVMGSWCRVAYKYTYSYVYCSLLTPGNSPGSVISINTASASLGNPVTNGLVTQSLNDTHNWLVTNNEGVTYINSSYFQAQQKAVTWDGEAKISDFYFQWPLLSDAKCSMTFSGPYHAQEDFKASCFDNNGVLKTWNESVTTPQQSYNLPILLFKNFVDNLLADKSLMGELDTYFANSKNVTALYRLYKNTQGLEIWEAKFIDESSGYFMAVSADATKTNGVFQVQQGMFQ